MTAPDPPEPPKGYRHRPVFDSLPEWVGPSTRAVHGARRPERNAGAIAPPIYQTSTYEYPPEFSSARDGGGTYLYTRMDNPTHEVAAELVRGLEGAEAARVFASGMGAISTTLLTFLSAGDEVVAVEGLYGGTTELFRDLCPRVGISVRWVAEKDSTPPDRFVRDATRVVFLESPTNPLLGLHDIAAWAKAAERVGALLVVDNTFATPVNQNPLALGADLVVHSGTKYLAGHSDAMAGVVAGPETLVNRIDRTHQWWGSVLDPFAAFLLARGIRTLPLRVARQTETGRRMADALAGEPTVRAVHYPGRGGEVAEALARRQMRGRGGVLSFELSGGRTAVQGFLRHLRLIRVASSFGGVESLVSVPLETSHRALSEAERVERGITPGLVRLSLGVEDPDDLIRDVHEALGASS